MAQEADEGVGGVSEWQPIETAPKGNEVQIWNEYGEWIPRAIFREGKGWIEEDWDGDFRCYTDSIISRPTHWMLPPDAPEGE